MTLRTVVRHNVDPEAPDTTACGRPAVDLTTTTRVTRTNCQVCLRAVGAASRTANTPPKARRPVKPRRAPRRRTAPQWTAEDWETANPLLLTRCAGRCEKCGHDLGNTMERHHRQRREVGGDRLANLVALHPACHQWVHAHPEEARANGWIVSAHDPDPAAVPVRIGGWLWVLRDDGTKHPVP